MEHSVVVKLHTQESHEQLHHLLEDLKAAEDHMNGTLRRLGAGEASREEAREAIQRVEEARQRYEAMDAQYRIPTDGRVVEYEYPETINDEELRQRLESSELPRVLVRNLLRTLDQGRRSRWIAVLKHDADGVLERLNSLLATGRRITGLDSDALIRRGCSRHFPTLGDCVPTVSELSSTNVKTGPDSTLSKWRLLYDVCP